MDRRDLLKSAIVGAAIAGPVIAEAAEQRPKLEIKKKGYITIECQFTNIGLHSDNDRKYHRDWLLEPTVFRIDMISNIRPVILDDRWYNEDKDGNKKPYYVQEITRMTTYELSEINRHSSISEYKSPEQMEAEIKSRINGCSFWSQGQMYVAYMKPEELVAMLEEKMS